MTMVWVDLKPGEGGCQPILDFSDRDSARYTRV